MITYIILIMMEPKMDYVPSKESLVTSSTSSPKPLLGMDTGKYFFNDFFVS